MLAPRGQLGYVSTNTLIEGDTLAVSLLQLESRDEWWLRRAESPHPWPSKSANLQIIELWTSKAKGRTYPVLDDDAVPNLSVDLQPFLRTVGRPYRLAQNENIAFQGSIVVGLGFTMTSDEAAGLIARDPRNAEALLPYVSGQDLNRRSDCSASRWIINFRGWSEERASAYSDLIERVRLLVKPERDSNNRANYRDLWWRYAEHRPGLYESIVDLEDVLAISLHGSVIMPVVVDVSQVFSHGCGIFALDDRAALAWLSSSVHQLWTLRYAGTLETRIRYSVSDVFLTLPHPPMTSALVRLGERLHRDRREVMLGRAWGLTRTYNAIHDATIVDPAVVQLRKIHEEIDHAVLAAYGWTGLDLDIGHHPTKVGTRWTVSREARFELLDRLLEENHRRHALESSQ